MIRFDSIQSRLTLVALAIIIGSSLAVGFAGFRLNCFFFRLNLFPYRFFLFSRLKHRTGRNEQEND